MKVNKEIIPYKNKDGSYVIYNKKNNHEIYMGQQEYKILMALSAEDNKEIIDESNSGYSSQNIEKLVELFRNSGLIENENSHNKIDVFNVNKLIVRFGRKKNEHMEDKKRILNILSCVVIPFFVFSTWINSSSFDLTRLDAFFNSLDYLKVGCLILTFLISIILHEMAHAIYASAIGLHVVGFSIGLENFIPNLKTVMCGIKKIDNKVDKIGMYMAGININLFMTSIGLLINTINYSLINDLGTCLFVCNVLIIFVNTLLLFNTDGLKVILVLLELEHLSNINMFSAGKLLKIYPKDRRCILSYMLLVGCCIIVALRIGG